MPQGLRIETWSDGRMMHAFGHPAEGAASQHTASWLDASWQSPGNLLAEIEHIMHNMHVHIDACRRGERQQGAPQPLMWSGRQPRAWWGLLSRRRGMGGAQ
jgi:hypothetical protein